MPAQEGQTATSPRSPGSRGDLNGTGPFDVDLGEPYGTVRATRTDPSLKAVGQWVELPDSTWGDDYSAATVSRCRVVGRVPSLQWQNRRPGMAYVIEWGGHAYAVEPPVIKAALAARKRKERAAMLARAPAAAAPAPTDGSDESALRIVAPRPRPR